MSRKIRDRNTGSIYRSGDGYRIQVIVGTKPDGTYQYYRPRFKSHLEAVEALKKAQTDIMSGRLVASTGQTLSDYLDKWLENVVEPNLAPKTQKLYRWIVKDHIKPTLGRLRIEKVTRKDIQRLLTAKAKQTVKPKAKKPEEMPTKTLSVSTLRNIRIVLHSAFADAIRDGSISQNPADMVDLPREAKEQAQFLKPEDAAKLNAVLEGHELGSIVRFLLATGCRIGEATGIRWQDLDLDRCFVHIKGQLQRIDKKLVYRSTTKTNQIRVIPLSPGLVENLKGMKLVAQDDDADGIVFLNAYGRRFDPKYFNVRLKELCKEAGVPEISAHKLRHTAATLALAETGDLHAVQKILGHSQVSLTSNLYGHATAETLRPITDAIERAMNRKPNQQKNESHDG